MVIARVLVSGFLFVFLFGCGGPIQQHLEEQKKKSEYHYKVGASQIQAGNPTQALKELLEAVKGDPRNPEINAALARAYQMKKAYELSEEHYKKALEYSDNDPRYQNNLASLYLETKNWDAAIKYFDEAAANLLFADSYIAFAGKGYAYYHKGEYQAAVEQYEEANSVAPKYARAYFLKSEALMELGRTAEARQALEKAVEIVPGYLEANYQLAVMLMKDGLIEAATVRLEKVVEVAPTSEWGIKAAELLRALK